MLRRGRSLLARAKPRAAKEPYEASEPIYMALIFVCVVRLFVCALRCIFDVSRGRDLVFFRPRRDVRKLAALQRSAAILNFSHSSRHLKSLQKPNCLHSLHVLFLAETKLFALFIFSLPPQQLCECHHVSSAYIR